MLPGFKKLSFIPFLLKSSNEYNDVPPIEFIYSSAPTILHISIILSCPFKFLLLHSEEEDIIFRANI